MGPEDPVRGRTDPSGASRIARAMLEDISANGASIRTPARIEVGSRVEIRWLSRQISGMVVHGHPDGIEHVFGIRKDPGQEPWPLAMRRQTK